MKWAAIAAVALAAAASPARAAEPAPAGAAGETDAEVAARLAYVVGALEREEPWARAWQDGWLFGFAGLALAQGSLALTATDGGVRAAAISGGVKSSLGFFGRLLVPITARTAATTLRGVRASTPAERRHKLHLAESMLQASAAEERFGRSWAPLVASALVNLAGAYVLWVGYHRYGSGWFGLGSGVAVSQLQYWTQPTGAMAAWDAYTRARRRGGVAPLAPPPPPPVRWSISPGVNGLWVQGAF